MMAARHFRRRLLILTVSTLGTSLPPPPPTRVGLTGRRLCPRRDTERIRLSDIDCPEKGQAYGQRVKQAVSALGYGKAGTLQTYGLDKYERTISRCTPSRWH